MQTMVQPDFSPAADRNKQPILELLRAVVPPQGEALEIASGTGQHVVWFAKHMPGWNWQPTDLHRGALYNIEAYLDQVNLDNVYAPTVLNVLSESWPIEPQTVDLVVCINMLHIAPWEACAGLMRGCARHLAPSGKLVTYGPYFEDEVSTAPSNLAFDESLRAHDPRQGIRRRADVEQAAAAAGLRCVARHAMAANNLLLVFERMGTD
jgi:SAM-dependent methyltransferase